MCVFRLDSNIEVKHLKREQRNGLGFIATLQMENCSLHECVCNPFSTSTGLSGIWFSNCGEVK